MAPGEQPDAVRTLLPSGGVPEYGVPADRLLTDTARLLFEHSTFNGHPRFFGYITAPAAPLGVLGEMLAAAVNPNCGGWSLSPAATEIERQAIRWIAELIGFPTTGAGLFVSGGNVANIVCFLAARAAKARHDVRVEGVAPGAGHGPLVCYASAECHTWIQKACDITGLGTAALRWIPTDRRRRMRVDALGEQVVRDRGAGMTPFLVVGSAGTTSTGAIDPLRDLGAFCREQELWYHIDGAYGAPAALVPGASEDLRAIGEADSVAVDPHKWLYAPLEAGCAIVRDPGALPDAFHYRPPYYHFDGTEEEQPVNFYEYGLQNSRGFRALKVWLTLRQVGRDGYRRMIADDIALTRILFDAVAAHPELLAVTCELSVATFAYVPPDMRERYESGDAAATRYVDELNAALLLRTQEEGRLYLSNAVVDERFLVRACIVNFRTTEADARAVAELVVDAGRRTDAAMRARPAEG
ncbi:MAG TPA: aspartate aminotransferase family protein [Gemmatimonadaceae bacterium]|nr:aspartate aminotransferase family protein [Gemmatimonadaceae bacterium]